MTTLLMSWQLVCAGLNFYLILRHDDNNIMGPKAEARPHTSGAGCAMRTLRSQDEEWRAPLPPHEGCRVQAVIAHITIVLAAEQGRVLRSWCHGTKPFHSELNSDCT